MPKHMLETSRYYLSQEYLPKIRMVTAPLSEVDMWWRPVQGSNSIANLLLHLEGNARQWMLSGVGGAPDVRDRDGEFAATGGKSKDELLSSFATVIRQIDSLLADLSPLMLNEPRVIQGAETTVFGAIYHVVEHMSMHTGQIIQLAKWRAPGAIRLYDASNRSFTPLWTTKYGEQ